MKDNKAAIEGKDGFTPIKRHCENACDWPDCTLPGCVVKLVPPCPVQGIKSKEDSYYSKRLNAAESFAYMLMMNVHKDVFNADGALKSVYEHWQKLIIEQPNDQFDNTYNTAIRTAAESILIAYDQMRDKLSSPPEPSSKEQEGDAVGLLDWIMENEWQWEMDQLIGFIWYQEDEKGHSEVFNSKQLYKLFKQSTTKP